MTGDGVVDIHVHSDPDSVARKLKAMLAKPSLAEQAKSIAQKVMREDGVKTACDALEALHAKTSSNK